jgi:hypothetical protein
MRLEAAMMQPHLTATRQSTRGAGTACVTDGEVRVMMRSGLMCMLIAFSAIAASVTVASQPLNHGESSRIAELVQARVGGPVVAHTADEAAYLAAQAWLEHIAPRRRWP